MLAVADHRWSSEAFAPDQRFKKFKEESDSAHFPWSMQSENPLSFKATVRRRKIREYAFSDFQAYPLTSRRTEHDIASSDDGHFCLLFLCSGKSVLRQRSNVSLLTPGSIAVWNSSEPASMELLEPTKQLSILMPHQTAVAMLPGIESMCGLAADGNSAHGRLLLSHLQTLHDCVDQIEPEHLAGILNATAVLFSASFRPESSPVDLSRYRQAVILRVQSYIMEHLSDADLSPSSIASAFSFSPRYLHKLFNGHELTIGEWIRKRRLQASRVDLMSSAGAQLSIAETAFRNGFTDVSHFSRAFKQEFGLSPRDYRMAYSPRTADADARS